MSSKRKFKSNMTTSKRHQNVRLHSDSEPTYDGQLERRHPPNLFTTRISRGIKRTHIWKNVNNPSYRERGLTAIQSGEIIKTRTQTSKVTKHQKYLDIAIQQGVWYIYLLCGLFFVSYFADDYLFGDYVTHSHSSREMYRDLLSGKC